MKKTLRLNDLDSNAVTACGAPDDPPSPPSRQEAEAERRLQYEAVMGELRGKLILGRKWSREEVNER